MKTQIKKLISSYRFQIYYRIFGLVLGIISVCLCLNWFDWKLLLVIFLFAWSNNINSSDGLKR